MPSRGNGPQPQISAGDSGTSSTAPTTRTPAGSSMLRPPRGALPRVLKIQRAPAPANTTLEYASAAASAPSVPPMARYRLGPPHSIPSVKAPPNPSAMTSACTTSASASRLRPPPSARAMAEATPPPMPPADIVCLSMISGKDEGHARERVAAQPSDEHRLQHVDDRLDGDDDDVGGGQPQQGAGDRRLEQHARASGEAAGGGGRGGEGGGGGGRHTCKILVTSFSVKGGYTGACPSDTASAARSPSRWRCSASAGRCSSSATCWRGRAGSRTSWPRSRASPPTCSPSG